MTTSCPAMPTPTALEGYLQDHDRGNWVDPHAVAGAVADLLDAARLVVILTDLGSGTDPGHDHHDDPDHHGHSREQHHGHDHDPDRGADPPPLTGPRRRRPGAKQEPPPPGP
jgi:hypothetical protein